MSMPSKKFTPADQHQPKKRKDASELNPVSYVLWLLGLREYSEKELRDKLTLRGFSIEAIDKGLGYAKESGYQSDGRYAGMKARSLSPRLGNSRIARELKIKGIGAEAVSEELSALAPELARALAVISKFEGQPLTQELRAKIYRFLAYRGFGFDIIKKAVDSLRDGAPTSVDDAD